MKKEILNGFHVEEIERIISGATEGELSHELSSVVYSLGRDVENEEEYDYAFSKLLEIYEKGNENVKTRVLGAFSMLAVLHKDIKTLDISIVEPLVIETYSRANSANKYVIQDAVDDINFSLKWNLNLGI